MRDGSDSTPQADEARAGDPQASVRRSRQPEMRRRSRIGPVTVVDRRPPVVQAEAAQNSPEL
jgi:hypothetical protein